MDGKCHICGQPLDETYAVSCIICGRRIHFQSADAPGDNCCSIVSQLSLCGLAFMCNACFDLASAEGEATSL